MEINQGVTFDVINATMFKEIGIYVRFNQSLEAKSACARSVLALMMSDRCQKYATKEQMGTYTDLLYGASLQAQTLGYGASHVLELSLKAIHPQYCEDESYMEHIFEFLHEIVFRPLLNEAVFQEAKTILKAKIIRANDDPTQYTISRSFQIAGKNTPLAISSLGDLELLETITLEDVVNTYEQMIHENKIHILVCGDLCEPQILPMIEQYFKFEPRNVTIQNAYHVSSNTDVQYVEEYRNISQTTLMMLLFTNCNIQDEQYYALRVANAILGQYPTSMLFQEVREKNSLCYSIFSNLVSFEGVLGIVTGIKKEHIDQTTALIRAQIQRLREGDFDEELLAISKDMIINGLRSSNDHMKSIVALEYRNALLGRKESVEDMIEQIHRVSKEDVISVMKQCVGKLTFVLTKEGDAQDGTDC